MKNYCSILLCLFLMLNVTIYSQWQVRDSMLFNPHVSVGFGYSMPLKDMAKRFGTNGHMDLGFHIKNKSNWYYGLQFSYLYGNSVSEPGLLANLITNDNLILSDNGEVASVFIQQRGFSALVEGGRVFNFIGPNKNSGLLIKGGFGFLQHKIRLEHQESKITQLEGEYLKGYDRLTNGLAISEFIGYYNMSNNRLINFYIGLNASQGFTECRRDFNFDTQTFNSGKRNDWIIGIRGGWILNLY
ncbi:MAG: hypothetical protein ACKO8Q_09230, partial [Bacteroidota bacterium]